MALHPHSHMVYNSLVNFSHFMTVMWYLIVILICISLITKDLEYFFKCLITIHVSCFTYVWSNILTILRLNCLFESLYWEYFLYCGYKSSIRYMISKYFLLVCGLSFYSFNNDLEEQKLLILMKFTFSFLSSYIYHCI